jgi:hypothetical protein
MTTITPAPVRSPDPPFPSVPEDSDFLASLGLYCLGKGYSPDDMRALGHEVFTAMADATTRALEVSALSGCVRILEAAR